MFGKEKLQFDRILLMIQCFILSVITSQTLEESIASFKVLYSSMHHIGRRESSYLIWSRINTRWIFNTNEWSSSTRCQQFPINQITFLYFHIIFRKYPAKCYQKSKWTEWRHIHHQQRVMFFFLSYRKKTLVLIFFGISYSQVQTEAHSSINQMRALILSLSSHL